MKLVEILARELSEWPDSEGVSCIVQDPDTMLYAKYRGDDNPFFEGGEWMSVWHEKKVSFLILPLATDHATAIVTREMWEAERARYHMKSQSGLKFTDVGELTSGQDIKVTLNDGTEYIVRGKVEALSDSLANDRFGDPRHNRDRIRAIDVQLAGLTAERAERVAELAAEGFALLPVVDVVDMEDWRNWQAGDLIEFVGGGSAHKDEPFTACRLYTVDFILPESFNMIHVASDDEGNKNGWRAEYFKFHSRPKPC